LKKKGSRVSADSRAVWAQAAGYIDPDYPTNGAEGATTTNSVRSAINLKTAKAPRLAVQPINNDGLQWAVFI
jgi:hypothetical protein